MPSLLDQLLKEKEKPSEAEIRKEKEKKNPLIQGKPNVQPDNGKDRFKLILESMGTGVEKYYFWITRFMKEEPDHGLGLEVEKIKDVFGASAGSSFHSQLGTKASAIQQQLSTYLAQIGQMVKSIYPQVRELRLLDERIEYYEASDKGDESAEIALKSIWIEQVEQGMQNPNSVYSLARQVGFITLPDLFFKINVKKPSDVDKAIKTTEAPKKVRDVLAKKLYAYYQWKDNTRREMKHRREFMVKSLRQHYNVIKLYMSWLRPYLKTLRSLEMRGDIYDSDIVNAFETSKLELELIAKGKGKKYIPCIRVQMTFITRPELSYTQQGQRQPTHMGRTEITLEPYVVTQEQIDDYKKKIDEEDIDFVASIDASMDALKDDLVKYLKEAEEGPEEEEKPKRPKADYLGPAKGLAQGFMHMLPAGKKKHMKQQAETENEEKKKAEKTVAKLTFLVYDIFKKVNGMMSA